MFEGWKGVIVMVSLFALLGLLVWLRVPEASVAAVAVITGVVGYLTRSPKDQEKPPPGATLVPLVGAGVAAALIASSCTPQQVRQVEAARDAFCSIAELVGCRHVASSPAEVDRCERTWHAQCDSVDAGGE